MTLSRQSWERSSPQLWCHEDFHGEYPNRFWDPRPTQETGEAGRLNQENAQKLAPSSCCRVGHTQGADRNPNSVFLCLLDRAAATLAGV